MQVKATKAGDMSLAGAKFSDGTTAAKTVKANDVVEVYADSTTTAISVSIP